MAATRGLIIGLTGGMACGKSSVASIWAEHGAHVLDADATVYRLLAEDVDVQIAVRDVVGEDAFDASGRVDRAALGRIVFGDEEARQQVMAILHPRTLASHFAAAAEFHREHPDGIAVIDAPLLFEAGADRRLDATVVVTAPYEVQIARSMERAARAGRPLTREDIERRIALQMPLEEKVRRATYLIANDGTLGELRVKAEALWRELTTLAPSRPSSAAL